LESAPQSRHSGYVKSFGRREAYESLRGTNPWAADDGLWVFLFSAERGEVTIGSGQRGTWCDLSELTVGRMALPMGVPTPIDQNLCAHWRNPMDMMVQG
jgi:hypothetical protein